MVYEPQDLKNIMTKHNILYNYLPGNNLYTISKFIWNTVFGDEKGSAFSIDLFLFGLKRTIIGQRTSNRPIIGSLYNLRKSRVKKNLIIIIKYCKVDTGT